MATKYIFKFKVVFSGFIKDLMVTAIIGKNYMDNKQCTNNLKDHLQGV